VFFASCRQKYLLRGEFLALRTVKARDRMKKTAAKILPFLLSALLLPACSSGSSTSAPTNDAGASGADAAAGDASSNGDDAGACGGIAEVGSVVAPAGNESDPCPKATGGTIVDGTYVLTARTQYEHDAEGNNSYIICGDELADAQETIQFAAGAIQGIGAYDDGTPAPFAGTFDTSGTTLKQHLTCPSVTESDSPYTATSTKVLIIGDPESAGSDGTCGPIVIELTRQQ
jgi:hypothetical protein